MTLPLLSPPPTPVLIRVVADDNGSGVGAQNECNEANNSCAALFDEFCSCVDDLAARPKLNKIQLTWTNTGAHRYNVYRSTVSGGPYFFIGFTSSTYSTFLDGSVTTGVTYYYVVREADALGRELCQSNEAKAVATIRR